MCTAYELGKRGGSFPTHIKAEAAGILLGLAGTSIIRPTLPAPVILPDGGLVTMQWGFRREFAPQKRAGKPVRRTIVNSREDRLGGIVWRGAFAERRCLIPAAAFYEWVEVAGENRPLRFQRPDDEWIWIAGLWEECAEHGRCYSMITTEPNTAVEPVHDRMPAVLDEWQIGPYLEGNLHEFGPSSVALEFREVENFLRNETRPATAGEKPATGLDPPPRIQGELELEFDEAPRPSPAGDAAFGLASPPCSMPEIP